MADTPLVGTGGLTPQQVSEQQQQRYRALDPTAPIEFVIGAVGPTPAIFITQQSKKFAMDKDDVVIPIREGIIIFCNLLAASIGMQCVMVPLTVPPQPNGNPA